MKRSLTDLREKARSPGAQRRGFSGGEKRSALRIRSGQAGIIPQKPRDGAVAVLRGEMRVVVEERAEQARPLQR